MFSADFYVVEASFSGEKKYFYNRRVWVSSPDFARKFSTKTNAKKTVFAAGITEFSVLKYINGGYLYC